MSASTVSETKEDLDCSSNGLLKCGTLKHHEIDKFYMDENKIDNACDPLTWSNCDATTFDVRRGPDYSSGQKAPSRKAIYKVFAIDGYKMKSKINKISSFVDISEYLSKYKVDYNSKTFPLPSLLIINVMAPNYSPPLMSEKTDGEGFQLVLYAHLSEDIICHLRKYEKGEICDLLPSIKLLSKFIHSETDSMIRRRFKVIARVMNLSKTKFNFFTSRLVNQYNGRPFLARTSSTFYHEKGKYFAVDIDAHLFGLPARKGLSYVKDWMNTVIFDSAFLIEGQKNDELPEQILCCARISKIGTQQATPFPNHLLHNYLNHKIKQKNENESQTQSENESENEKNETNETNETKIDK